MGSQRNRVTRPRPGPEWTVQDVRSYAYWCDGTAECATCGATVDLAADHHGLELIRRRPGGRKRHLDRERYVFCSDGCVAAWRRA